ncbi:MAG: TIGR03905 family TSCPD domain-containing protein [Lachnospiraceae bacterium]|nr:TIGR03905 family TSCPD domain-containing protein [Lachnospiraceae bacterium]
MEVYKTLGTCSQAIEFEVDGDTIQSVHFVGGCDGNTQGVAALVKGMKVEDAISRLEGIDCRGRGTSCPDQLARALKGYVASH